MYSHHLIAGWVWEHTCNLIMRKAETGAPWSKLTSQTSQINGHLIQVMNHASISKVERDKRWHLVLVSGLHKCPRKHMCTHIHRNIHIHMETYHRYTHSKSLKKKKKQALSTILLTVLVGGLQSHLSFLGALKMLSILLFFLLSFHHQVDAVKSSEIPIR